MAYTVSVQREVDLPQKVVFNALNDFCGIKKLLPDMIDSVECSGSGIGMLRSITLQGGGKVIERLEISRENDLFGYSIIENDALPLTDYFAFVDLKTTSETKTAIIYQSNFKATGDNSEEMTGVITQLYNSIIDGIVAIG